MKVFDESKKDLADQVGKGVLGIVFERADIPLLAEIVFAFSKAVLEVWITPQNIDREDLVKRLELRTPNLGRYLDDARSMFVKGLKESGASLNPKNRDTVERWLGILNEIDPGHVQTLEELDRGRSDTPTISTSARKKLDGLQLTEANSDGQPVLTSQGHDLLRILKLMKQEGLE